MALPSSGQISLGALADNKSSASRADVAMKAYSELFASGSAVGDVDDSGTADETADRNALNSLPYSLSEFHSAQYPNTFFDTVLARNDGDTATFTDTVDAETIKIKWTVNTVPSTTTYTAGLKLVTDNSVQESGTTTSTTTGAKTVTIISY